MADTGDTTTGKSERQGRCGSKNVEFYLAHVVYGACRSFGYRRSRQLKGVLETKISGVIKYREENRLLKSEC